MNTNKIISALMGLQLVRGLGRGARPGRRGGVAAVGGSWKEVESGGHRGVPGRRRRIGPAAGAVSLCAGGPAAGTTAGLGGPPWLPPALLGDECGWGLATRIGVGVRLLSGSGDPGGTPAPGCCWLPSGFPPASLRPPAAAASPCRTLTPAGAWATHGSPNAPEVVKITWIRLKIPRQKRAEKKN